MALSATAQVVLMQLLIDLLQNLCPNSKETDLAFSWCVIPIHRLKYPCISLSDPEQNSIISYLEFVLIIQSQRLNTLSNLRN